MVMSQFFFVQLCPNFFLVCLSVTIAMVTHVRLHMI